MEPIPIDGTLTLRPPRRDDAEALVRLVDDARRRADPLLPWWTEHPTDDDARAWAAAADTPGARWLATANGVLIGTVGVMPGEPPGTGVLSCWLAPAFDDFATRGRICEAAVDHAFRVLACGRLLFVCGEDDAQSMALAAQLGFEERARVNEPAIYVAGGYRTVVTFALEAAAWRPRAG